MAGNPGHAGSQGAAFYAQDFTSDISVRTVSGHCHGTKHGLSYTQPGDTKHNRDNEWHNQHADRNDLNPDRNNFHHAIGFDGDTANFPAWKHEQRQSCSNSGNARRCRQRRISDRRNTRHHADADGNFNHGGAMHSFQQHRNVDNGEQHAFHGQHFCYGE